MENVVPGQAARWQRGQARGKGAGRQGQGPDQGAAGRAIGADDGVVQLPLVSPLNAPCPWPGAATLLPQPGTSSFIFCTESAHATATPLHPYGVFLFVYFHKTLKEIDPGICSSPFGWPASQPATHPTHPTSQPASQPASQPPTQSLLIYGLILIYHICIHFGSSTHATQ